MAIKQVNPYLMFNGTALGAIKLYERALGAKTEGLSRYGDVPGSPQNPETKDRIIHALLHIGPGIVMVSDSRPDDPVAEGNQNNVQVTLDFDDAAEMAQRFDALGAGGKITMPVQDTFWGAKFGMLTDAFGIQWMFNCTTKKA